MPDPAEGASASPDTPSNLASLEVRRIKAAAHAKLFGDAAGATPQKIARYTVLQSLGVGGMGEVYLTYDSELGRKVAIKLVREGPGSGLERATSRLIREAQALAQLSHPNVVQVYETGSFEGRVFIAMEFVRGVHMRRWLDVAPRTWRQVLDAYIQAGQGLAAAHRRGMVHRDFKPENVLVGDDGRVRVVDFGLVRSTPEVDEPPQVPGNASADDFERSSRLTQSGVLMGTPSYMSPEQFQGLKVTATSDQFAFCVALYRGLYGWHPFASESRAELKRRILSGQIAPPPRDAKVPAGIFTVLVRGLHADPDQRYPSMEALLAALVAPPGQHRLGLIAATGLLAAAAALAVSLGASSVDRACATRVSAATLDPAHTLAGAFDGKDLPAYAGPTTARAAAQLSQYAAELRNARIGGACTELRLDDRLQARHDACLDRRARDLAVVTRAIGQLRPDAIAGAQRLAESLPALAPCFDPDVLVGLDPGPGGSPDALDDARVLALAGRPDDAAKQAGAAYKNAGTGPLRAEALALLGRLAFMRDARDQGHSFLVHAQTLALAGRDDDLLADILRTLAEFTRDDDDARIAFSAAERLRDPQRLTEIALIRAEILLETSEFTTAEMLLRDALARSGDRPATAARIELLRGRMFARQDKHHEAGVHLGRALSLQAGQPGHPAVADILEERARLHLRLGERSEARLRFGEALAIRDALPGSDPGAARLHLALADLATTAGERSRAHRHYTEAVALSARSPDLLDDLIRARTARDTATTPR